MFARNPHNEAIVCYNACCCKYLTEAEKETYQKVGSQKPREYSLPYINEFIKTAREHGYLVSYNHPYWSMEDEANILACEGCFSMEMCNYSSYLLNGLEYNAVIYDKMLLAGKRIFCHSADDNHNAEPEGTLGFDSFGGFTMIMPKDFSYEAIITAMEKGEMYSSMGPLLKEVSMEGNKIHIECSKVKIITVFTGSKFPKRCFAAPDGWLSSADFEIDDRAKFVRVSIEDEAGRKADTRGYLRDELPFKL